MRERRTTPIPTTGGSALLVIFAVLCLTVFALLAISTVQANRRLSERSAEASLSYHAADLEAERILAALRDGSHPDTVTDWGDGLYAYVCPVSEGQALFVNVHVDGETYQILRWQLCSTADWDPQDDLAVWSGTG